MERILIVDDDQQFRSAMRKVLEKEGYAVVEAESGSSGLDAYRREPADMVLTDVYMPDTDGIEAMIRLHHEFPDARIVVTSGGGYWEKDKVLQAAARLGAQRTLPKPVERGELLEVVRSVLGEQV